MKFVQGWSMPLLCKVFGFLVWTYQWTLFSSRKFPYFPLRKDWNFLRHSRGSLRLKHLIKKCIKLNWNFQGGGGLGKNAPNGGGTDIFWNYALWMSEPLLLQFLTCHLLAPFEKTDLVYDLSKGLHLPLRSCTIKWPSSTKFLTI